MESLKYQHIIPVGKPVERAAIVASSVHVASLLHKVLVWDF